MLGDRFGTTADRHFVDRVEAILTAEGLRVLRNTPFAGNTLWGRAVATFLQGKCVFRDDGR